MSKPDGPPRGPPYAPPTATLGGVPTVPVDVPITAVFLCFYLAGVIINFALLRFNLKRNHRFLISWALGGFCMSRVLTCIMRIAWATNPTNVSVALAAQIFTNAGVIMVYVVNMLLAQRILRARQPAVGWTRIFHWTCVALYTGIGLAIALVISMIVFSAYTLNLSTLQAARDVELVALTYITIFAFLAPAILILSLSLSASVVATHFGKRSIQHKAIVLGVSTSLQLVIACFRVSTTWQSPRPKREPAWYDSRAAFYCFGFVVEILIVLLLTVARIDLTFHVPNGSSKRRSYMEEKEGCSRTSSGVGSGKGEEVEKETC
ncbi:hypothetical protein LTR91_022159 [Friedmanniomyces endolithicus]|uniref:Uncharacterized protein n=1 Tax=Friedmanniomyces endolithicus TaxID=329885 RepID=A0AAN6K4B4_9PEZI|nr:hypothetical protein LTR94_021486 [Friedmanniomyces endolithicus]KAK0777740.1 hypothetical protein LTR59_013759 [Friedmanniomyces endolithicus]KAK0794476.1 hypothetical protein LTR38_009237 [Friedmanniomyces endolithicus]KAK0817636.1 hypothetical protein LTR75_002971 [Friedmanniomyces endolithicus]KAK0836792.1 hypothetical protein LTR03_013362 [Friedmanniomyces endolithicus]